VQETAGALVGSSKVATNGEQSSASSRELIVPEEQSTAVEPTHFAWVKLRYTDRSRTSSNLLAHLKASFEIGHSNWREVSPTEGIFSLKGSEEAISLALKEVENVLAEERRQCRMPSPEVAEFEILQMGLVKNMLGFKTIRHGPVIIHKSHFAWVKLPLDDGAVKRLQNARYTVKADYGCQVSDVRQISPAAGVMRLTGDEPAIRSAIDSLQALVVDEGRKNSDTPAAKIEIIEMGLNKDEPAIRASLESLYPDTASTISTSSEAAVAEPTDHRSIARPSGKTPEERASQVASSSLSGYSYRSPTLDSPHQGSDAKKAEKQPATCAQHSVISHSPWRS
jgi:hypothetical protein